ncbi:MAG TPA: hypothetical protein VIK62_02485 [Verrucomicrobiae bacterium]
MNNRADQESLLAEVLAEASPPDFRAAMLAETLRRVRRRRQFRQTRQVAGALAATILLVVVVSRQFSKPTADLPPLAKEIATQNYELVRTQPLPPGAIVSTRSFPATGFAATVPDVVEVATISGGYRLINDNELLALLADKPAVLIRTGPGSEELVFANAEDRKKLLANY